MHAKPKPTCAYQKIDGRRNFNDKCGLHARFIVV